MPQQSSLPYLDAAEVAALVPIGDAIEALRSAFASQPSHVARTHLSHNGAEFLAMPAASGIVLGTKLITIQSANPAVGLPIIQGLYVLFDSRNGKPVALLDGAALTNLRTPAASALATSTLARNDAASIGIIGTGPQALRHPAAIQAVRPAVQRVVVAGRTQTAVDAVVAQMLDQGIQAIAGSVADAVACDIVCTCTRASEPLFPASWIRPGTHLNLVGSYRLDLREVDALTVSNSTVVVDEIEAARAEAGDLAAAVGEGVWSWDRVAGDLSSVSTGVTKRQTESEITMFKSVGLAVQDVIVAQQAAIAAGLMDPDGVMA